MTTMAATHEKRSDGTSRTRSFGGCSTCRSRHMKCDEGRPACSTCEESGLCCGGYEKNIFFHLQEDGGVAEGAVRFRRPMLSQEERQRMSECLISSIPPKSALRSILQIDEECENAIPTLDLQVCKGPFGAFRLDRHYGGVFANLAPSEDDGFTASAMDPTGDSSAVDVAMSPATQQFLQSILDDAQSDQTPSSPIPQLGWGAATDSGRVQEILDDAALSDVQEAPPQISSSAPQDYSFPEFVPQPLFCETAIPPTLTPNQPVPHNAVLLLQHYSTTVLSLLTPFRHTKTPWHVLFIPHAKSCLAALTLGEHLDHASFSMFYGTLAVSAFSLGGISQAPAWVEQAHAYKQLARQHTRGMLKTAYDVPKISKYKSILMALITMVQVSMFSGNRDQTECYFLEAEKFIRLKGLTRRPKSRKVRLLHHLYAWERIFHEGGPAVPAAAPESRHRRHVRQAIEASGLVVPFQDSLSFALPAWTDLQQEMGRVKARLDGENDLHLERPGTWPGTLHPEIFGMPEPWLFAMSLVVRLGREKDAAEQQQQEKGGGRSPLSLRDFLARAQAIERLIHQLQWPSDAAVVGAGLQRLLGVMQTALAIYFYRRIYDVDAGVLQPQVRRVRDCLLRLDEGEPQQHASARFIWPALVAAREAADPAVQAAFAGWFQSCARQSGLQVFTDTLAVVSQAWEAKRRTAIEGNCFFRAT